MKIVTSRLHSKRTWTTFWDMHSGGGQKHVFDKCFIEAPLKEAVRIFMVRFGTDPYRVTCDCCGEDYAIDEETQSLAAATNYHRSKYVPDASAKNGYSRKTVMNTKTYISLETTEVIWADEITSIERGRK